MKLLKYLSVAVVIIIAFSGVNASAKNKVVPVYMYGFSASFNDSIVYFTDIQRVDSAFIDSKTNFLMGRDNYAYQLRDYLEQQVGLKNRTCVVMFSLKRTDLEKKLVKMKHKYTEKKNFDINYLTTDKFKFERIDMTVQEIDSATEAEMAKKAAALKNEKKQIRGARPDGARPEGMPGGMQQGGMPGGGMQGGRP